MTHREKVLKRLNELLYRCHTQPQRDMVNSQIEYAKTCSEEQILLLAE